LTAPKAGGIGRDGGGSVRAGGMRGEREGPLSNKTRINKNKTTECISRFEVSILHKIKHAVCRRASSVTESRKVNWNK
jgi:hypothetical protein